MITRTSKTGSKMISVRCPAAHLEAALEGDAHELALLLPLQPARISNVRTACRQQTLFYITHTMVLRLGKTASVRLQLPVR